ncbi:MAG: histidine phosphatase family protein [Ilumatobacteraceae bacterium]
MTRLVLVRHGESKTTVARVIGGPRTCSGLSELGRQQTERLRDRWATSGEVVADVLISSQYARARETAEILAPAIGDLAVIEEPGFGEHDPGPDCDGMSFDEYIERYGAGWWEGDPFGTSFPGGETVAAFQFRVGRAIRRTIDAYADKTVVVVCHGGVVDAALRLALKSPPTGGFEIHTLNTSITEIHLIKDNLWRLIRYNDVGHLLGLPSHTTPLPTD